MTSPSRDERSEEREGRRAVGKERSSFYQSRGATRAPTRGDLGRFRAAGTDWDRFWGRVEVGPGCWQWTGPTTRDGYGVFRVKARGEWRPVRAHRWAYQLARGPIPDGHTLDHVCHTADRDCPGGPACPHRSCVRFDHLTPVTNAENVARRHARARRTDADR